MWASSGWATIGASTPSTSSSTAECLGSSRSGWSRSSIGGASEGTLSVWLHGTTLQQVADLGEQADVVGRRLRLGRFPVASRSEGVQRLDDEEEDHRRDRHERDDRVDHVAVLEQGPVDREGQGAEVV